MTRPLSDLLAGWEARARMLDENARAEQSEQTARHYAARAAELRDCIEALEREVRAAAQAEAEDDTPFERVMENLHNCRDFKLTAPDRDGQWTAEFEYDGCGFKGHGNSPEAALLEAAVDRTIADHYYYGDMNGPLLTEIQMTDLLNTAYMTYLGHLPGHAYRGDYLRDSAQAQADAETSGEGA